MHMHMDMSWPWPLFWSMTFLLATPPENTKRPGSAAGRSLFSILFNVAASGGKSPRPTIVEGRV